MRQKHLLVHWQLTATVKLCKTQFIQIKITMSGAQNHLLASAFSTFDSLTADWVPIRCDSGQVYSCGMVRCLVPVSSNLNIVLVIDFTDITDSLPQITSYSNTNQSG